jgi:RNA recognition motif-containing protein
VKLIRDKQTGQLQGYGFVEFVSHAAAERVLTTFNGQMMPNVEMAYRLNWASAGEKRDDTPDYTIFVGDLAADVTDYMLQETFRAHYPSVKGAKVFTDKHPTFSYDQMPIFSTAADMTRTRHKNRMKSEISKVLLRLCDEELLLRVFPMFFSPLKPTQSSPIKGTK